MTLPSRSTSTINWAFFLAYFVAKMAPSMGCSLGQVGWGLFPMIACFERIVPGYDAIPPIS